jgi:hypothetical protein
MMLRKAVTYVAFVVAAVAVVAFGSWLGTMYGEHRLRDRRAADLSAQTWALHSEVRGIRVGEPLPAVLVWSVDGDRAFEIRRLLPEGGVILLVSPRCDVCITSAEEMQRSVAGDGINKGHAILLTSQAEGGRVLRDTLKARGVTLEVYCDLQESFLRELHVTANPAFFVLNRNGIVTDFGAGVPDGARLAKTIDMSR